MLMFIIDFSLYRLISICTGMTTAQIEAENTQMTNDLYRLLKKYTGLRNLIRDLKVYTSEPSTTNSSFCTFI